MAELLGASRALLELILTLLGFISGGQRWPSWVALEALPALPGRSGEPLARIFGRSSAPPSHRHVSGASGTHFGIDFGSKYVYCQAVCWFSWGGAFAMVFALIFATRFLSKSFSTRVGLKSATLLPTHKNQWFFTFFDVRVPAGRARRNATEVKNSHTLTEQQT